MKLFGGLSFPGPGRSRFGVSWRGRGWLGLRGRSGPLYAGALLGAGTPRHEIEPAGRAGPSGVMFRVYRGGVVTVDGRIVSREDLRRVLAVADAEAKKPQG